MICLAPVIVKYMKRILLQQANFDSPLAFRYQLIYQGYTV